MERVLLTTIVATAVAAVVGAFVFPSHEVLWPTDWAMLLMVPWVLSFGLCFVPSQKGE